MADQPDKHEKQFDPSPQRLEKAREEGNVFQSQEITSVGLLATAAAILFAGVPVVFDHLEVMTRRLYRGAASIHLTVQETPRIFAQIILELGLVLLPFFGALAVVSAGLSMFQTGANVTLKPLQPKFSRVNPIEGLKRLFSSRGLFSAFKAIAKIAVVGPLAYFFVKRHLAEILLLHTLPLARVIETAGGWMLVLVAQVLLALVVLSALDYAFEKWRHKEDLKMTKREVEDEHKEQEGDPQMKGRREEMAQEMRDRPRLDHAVLDSDVVVTNPTHYAIALCYDPGEAAAPRVLVKGLRKRAQRIKALAAEHEVPTVEDRPLAHALYDQVPEREEIPAELYPAVAAILAEVYRARDEGYGG